MIIEKTIAHMSQLDFWLLQLSLALEVATKSPNGART
jgi:hypothetical protein